jgi:SAM-dependent methyltransferase
MDDLKQNDPTEYATIWGLSQPHLRDQLYQTYHSGAVAADARRFYASDEFRETVSLLSELGKKPGHGLRLLDVGCGNGIACYAFARTGYAVTGTDISEGQLAGLRGARSLIGLDEVDFRIVNANMELMDTAETFDVVYMRQALHHSHDPVSTVGSLSRSLTPGGIFCAVREHVILNDAQRRQFLAQHPFQHITQDEHAFTIGTYRNAFRSAGLVLRRELYPYDSAINFHPGSWQDLVAHLSRKAHIDLQRHGRLRHVILRALAVKHQVRRDQMYSFFAQKPAEALD